MYNPHQVTKEFEAALCEYTGAPFAVAVNSCTMAILLALHWSSGSNHGQIARIPKHTYVSVPQSAIHVGMDVEFTDVDWVGTYQISPFPVWDCAKRFTSGMYVPGQYQCVSFHSAKILGDTQGGAILHDNPEADTWFRKARFDGRTEGVPPSEDHFDMIGYHCYLSPDVSARLLLKLKALPKDNPDQPADDYPDLSKFEVFQ